MNTVSWAKMDDRYDDNRKVKRAWRRHPRAVGLHAMAITYCCRHRTDGIVDIDWLEERLPVAKERAKVIGVLVDLRLFEEVDEEHWYVHDFLEYNPSSDEREAQSRGAKAAALARWGKRTAGADSSDAHADPQSNTQCDPHSAAHAEPNATPHPDPTKEKNAREARTSSSSSTKKKGPVEKAEAAGFAEWLLDHSVTTGRTAPAAGTKAYAALASAFNACRAEGHDLGALKLATRGAHGSEFRRTNNYDKAENVLRVTKVHGLIDDGRRAERGSERQADLTAKLVGS